MAKLTSMEAASEPALLYAVLTFDGRKLLLPQAEVRSLEPLLDIEPITAEFSDAVGTIAFGGEYWPVYCLDWELALLNEVPNIRRVCVVLSVGEAYLGLLCDQIAPFGSSRPALQPMPACMARSYSPFHALTIHAGEIACVTTAAQLWAFLQSTSDAGAAYG